MWEKKRKKFEGDSPLFPNIHFCYCVCVCAAQQIINSLYFFFIIYFDEDFFFFFKRLDISHSNLRIEWEK